MNEHCMDTFGMNITELRLYLESVDVPGENYKKIVSVFRHSVYKVIPTMNKKGLFISLSDWCGTFSLNKHSKNAMGKISNDI